jgi:hypothetical protein
MPNLRLPCASLLPLLALALPALSGEPPRIKPVWETSLFAEDPAEETAEIRLWLQQILAKYAEQPLIPSGIPVVAGKQVVVRSYHGVAALTLEKRTIDQETLAPGKHFWQSIPHLLSLQALKTTKGQLYLDPLARSTLWSLAEDYERLGKELRLLESRAAGGVSCDETMAYAVETLAIPALSQRLQAILTDRRPPSPKVPAALTSNELTAFQLETGKLRWARGSQEEAETTFHESYFLGPPLLSKGQLIVPNETQNGEIQLAYFEPLADHPPILRWRRTVTTLAEAERYRGNGLRRYASAPLALGGGTLVLAPNAGEIFGVDHARMWVRWTFRYRAEQKPPVPNPFAPGQATPVVQPAPHWKATMLGLHDDKVIFTAVDDPAIYGVGLRDGKLRWKAPPEGSFLLAGIVAARAVLIGPQGCRALDLDAGKEAWKLDLGVPSGQGTAIGDIYYQPLKLGAASRRPEIVAIDVARGKIVRRWLTDGQEPPGNLVAHRGQLLSQSVTTVALYPVLIPAGKE